MVLFSMIKSPFFSSFCISIGCSRIRRSSATGIAHWQPRSPVFRTPSPNQDHMDIAQLTFSLAYPQAALAEYFPDCLFAFIVVEEGPDLLVLAFCFV